MRWVCSCDKIGLGCQLTGRLGDTKVCGLANDLHVVLVGTARDALRYQAMLCVVIRGQFVPCTRVQVDAGRDALRYHAVGVQAARGQVLAELPTVGTHWCYHGLWVGNDLHVGAGRYRSGRFAIPCGGVRGRSWTVSDCVADGRDASARCAPGCWVGHFTLVMYYTCLRGASGIRLLSFGQLLV